MKRALVFLAITFGITYAYDFLVVYPIAQGTAPYASEFLSPDLAYMVAVALTMFFPALGAVSYTHLDVYKRQILLSSIVTGAAAFGQCRKGIGYADCRMRTVVFANAQARVRIALEIAGSVVSEARRRLAAFHDLGKYRTRRAATA